MFLGLFYSLVNVSGMLPRIELVLNLSVRYGSGSDSGPEEGVLTCYHFTPALLVVTIHVRKVEH